MLQDRHALALWISAAVALSTAACASATTTQRADRNLITLEQIESAKVQNAYELVLRYRPAFLRSRGPSSINRSSEPRVYLDAVELGGVSTLTNISTSSIAGILFVEGNEAMTKYGSDHVGGVIQIYSRR